MECPKNIIKVAEEVALTPSESDELKGRQLKKSWPLIAPHAVGLGAIVSGGAKIHHNTSPITRFGPYSFNRVQHTLLRKGRVGGRAMAGLGAVLALGSGYLAHRAGSKVKKQFIQEKETNRLKERV